MKNPVFFNNQIIPFSEVKFSPFDRGLLFADGVYEVIRVYEGKINFLPYHAERLKRSLSELEINCDIAERLPKIIGDLIKSNQLEGKDALVYLQITRGAYQGRAHWYSVEEVEPTVLVKAESYKHPQSLVESGVKCVTTADNRWARCDIKSISLLPNALASEKARKSNCYEAIFVRDGIVTECSRANLFGVKDGVIYTHPKSNYILPGVTRRVVVDILEKNTIPLSFQPITEEQLLTMDELFLTGSGSTVLGITSVNEKMIGSEVGKVTREIQEKFYKIAYQ